MIETAEDELSKSPFWERFGISTNARSKRMKDVEFVSILMLVILERKFVGFPQDKIDELYAKYDFTYSELPDSEDDIQLDDDVEEFFNGATKETVAEFERAFEQCKKFISSMENHNSCITEHKRRITTDLYSLWAVLALESDIIQMPPADMAEKYSNLISQVFDAFTLAKDGMPTENLDNRVQLYFGNSTGAATEVDNRKRRHEALLEFLRQ